MPLKKEISLVPGEGNSGSIGDRIIYWVSNVLRYIMVFTELIIIIAFLSRFSLDQQNTDLSDRLRNQKYILETTTNFEKEYGLLQQKLQLIKKLYAQQPKYYDKLSSILANTPSDIIYNSFSVYNKDSKVTADLMVYAFQEEAIVDFINQLSLNPQIKSITINTIEKKARENKYNINLSLSL